MDDQDPVCLGCHRSIEEGSVVAFGEGLWHVQWQVSVHLNSIRGVKGSEALVLAPYCRGTSQLARVYPSQGHLMNKHA